MWVLSFASTLRTCCQAASALLNWPEPDTAALPAAASCSQLLPMTLHPSLPWEPFPKGGNKAPYSNFYILLLIVQLTDLKTDQMQEFCIKIYTNTIRFPNMFAIFCILLEVYSINLEFLLCFNSSSKKKIESVSAPLLPFQLDKNPESPTFLPLQMTIEAGFREYICIRQRVKKYFLHSCFKIRALVPALQ